MFFKIFKREIQKKLDREGIANALLNDIADLSNHQFLKNENAIINNERISIAALPIKLSKSSK